MIEHRQGYDYDPTDRLEFVETNQMTTEELLAPYRTKRTLEMQVLKGAPITIERFYDQASKDNVFRATIVRPLTRGPILHILQAAADWNEKQRKLARTIVKTARATAEPLVIGNSGAAFTQEYRLLAELFSMPDPSEITLIADRCLTAEHILEHSPENAATTDKYHELAKMPDVTFEGGMFLRHLGIFTDQFRPDVTDSTASKNKHGLKNTAFRELFQMLARLSPTQRNQLLKQYWLIGHDSQELPRSVSAYLEMIFSTITVLHSNHDNVAFIAGRIRSETQGRINRSTVVLSRPRRYGATIRIVDNADAPIEVRPFFHGPGNRSAIEVLPSMAWNKDRYGIPRLRNDLPMYVAKGKKEYRCGNPDVSIAPIPTDIITSTTAGMAAFAVLDAQTFGRQALSETRRNEPVLQTNDPLSRISNKQYRLLNGPIVARLEASVM